MKTLKAVGSDLFDRQCVGRGEQRMHGDPVWFKMTIMIVIFVIIMTIMIVIFMTIITIMIIIIMIIIIISSQCVGRGECTGTRSDLK